MSSILSTAVVCFPLWFSLWSQAPVSSDQLSGVGKVSVKQEQLDMLSRHYSSLGPGLRMTLARQLSAAPIPAGQELFVQMLQKENNPCVKANLLRMLPSIGLAERDMSCFLKSPDILVQQEALKIYGRQKAMNLQKIRHFLNDESPVLRKCVWNILADGKGAEQLDWNMAANMQDDPDPEFRAPALRAVCFLQPRPAEVGRWLDKAVKEGPLMRMAAAADPAPDKRSRIEILASDRLPAVKIQLCLAEHNSFKEVFLNLLEDGDAAVRAAACRKLAGYDHLSEDDFNRLAGCLNDPSVIVRQKAELALTELLRHHQTEFAPLVHILLTEDRCGDFTAAALFRIAAELRLLQEMELAESVLVKHDRAPEVLAAALHLLAVSAPENYAEKHILALGSHRSPMVRQAVAEACGRLKLQGAVPVLKSLGKLDQPQNVREEAFLAMGRHADAAFASDVLRCLKQVTKTSFLERANAAWAAGHLKKSKNFSAEHLKLVKKMVQHCTTPVIPGMMPMFDNLEVIVNAMISMAVMKKNFGEPYGSCFEQVRVLYDFSPEKLKEENFGDMVPRSEAVSDVIAQLKKYFSGEKPVPSEIPGSFLVFSLAPLQQEN